VRQLFRLSLEALFYWALVHLENASRSIDWLVNAFLDQATPSPGTPTAQGWLASLSPSGAGPTELITAISQSFDAPGGGAVARAIATGLAFCLTGSAQDEAHAERNDRLPLSRARQEADARLHGPVPDFIRHVLESWVLAQHTYWSVGRGLADARARGRILLRLRVILDEGGWTITPGASRGNPPRPTLDRLQTAMTLATECGLFEQAQININI
jgi:hypothetical protein